MSSIAELPEVSQGACGPPGPSGGKKFPWGTCWLAGFLYDVPTVVQNREADKLAWRVQKRLALVALEVAKHSRDSYGTTLKADVAARTRANAKALAAQRDSVSATPLMGSLEQIKV